MARKSWYLLHRSCWVTLEISTLLTSPRMEIPLAWMSTDLCWNMQIGIMYTCAKIMPNCQTSMNESRWRTKYFDGKKCGEFVRIGKFGSTFSIWQECQSVWIWNLCHRLFFYVLKFTFDRPLGSDDLIHIFNPNSENISLTSGILKMFFKYSLALFYWAMNYVSH